MSPLPRQTLLEAIPHCLTATDLSLPKATKYTGKVRDTFDLTPGDAAGQLLLITTDRQSGFDRLLGAIPFKGQVLNRTSLFWFEQTKHLVPNHVLSSPQANALLARKCRVLPIEFVVRGFLTGSTDTAIWTMYNAGDRRFGGVTLPDGMRKNEPLPTHLITPTTKETAHDRPITPEAIVSENWLTQEQWEFCSAAALQLFRFGQETAAKRGLILVDTKYEFGVDSDGQIRLIDEIHTPDSSRYWLADSYAQRLSEGREPDMIDKEFFRLWFRERCDPYKDAVLPTAPADLIVELASRYIQLFEAIAGETFIPDTRPLNEAILSALPS
ncbi:MAG: phosphoribosylaminoimidazolesuccinocarboxamide synthase [Janthinobacterium lividum]